MLVMMSCPVHTTVSIRSEVFSVRVHLDSQSTAPGSAVSVSDTHTHTRTHTTGQLVTHIVTLDVRALKLR